MPRTRPDEMRAIEHEFHNLRDLDRCYVVPDLQDVAKKRARVSRQKAQKAQRRAAQQRSADILVGLPAPPRQAGFGVGARFGPTRMSALLRLARKSSPVASVWTHCSGAKKWHCA